MLISNNSCAPLTRFTDRHSEKTQRIMPQVRLKFFQVVVPSFGHLFGVPEA